MPKNVVLVDTPGFLQALGSNRKKIDTLSSREGVVFADLDAAYEYYYPRANLVLWAFRADRINDRDTIETFETLSQQQKSVLGVITYFDLMKSEEERQEVLRRAGILYGTKVVDFHPVITGGKNPNLGYGISALQQQLASVSEEATPIKQEEASQFIRNEASACQKWMTQKGDLLIENVSQISFYCNATSGGLLKEAKSSNLALTEYFQSNTVPHIEAPDFSTFIRSILKESSNLPSLVAARSAGRPASTGEQEEMAELFRRYISEKLRIPDLNKQFQSKLHYISGYIVAEGKRQSAGHHLTQIRIHQTSQIEKRKLEGQILPPNVQNLSVEFPTLPVPVIFSSGTDEFLDFIGSLGDFAGGVLKFFGWKSKAEANERLMVSAIADTKHSARNLPLLMEEAIRDYVQHAAHAILKSADEATSKVYPGKDLISLKDDAIEIDDHLNQLQIILQLVPVQDDSQYLYKTLFALWSPRDDPRKAVIDVFCEWFDKKESELSSQCRNWLTEAIINTQIEKANLEQITVAYLMETKQSQKMVRPLLAGTISRSPLFNEVGGLVLRWSSHIAQNISRNQLFNDQENFLKIKFDGFELHGIAGEFSKALALDFQKRFEKHFNSRTIYADSDKMARFEARKTYGKNFIKAFSAIGLGVAISYGVFDHVAGITPWTHFVDSLGFGAGAFGVSFTGNTVYQILAFRRRRRDEMVAAVSSEILDEASKCAEIAWKEAHNTLNGTLARQIIGQKTLIKKRTLDFAIEGEFTGK